MKVFLVGGTGLLGAMAAKIFIERGHKVTAVALPGVPEGADIPKEMDLHFCDINKISDDEVKKLIKGCDAFVFASGIDERVECPAPVYDWYDKYNIKPLERLIPMCKEAGIKKAVVLGSYFSMLNKDEYWFKTMLPKGILERNPYIRARVKQEEVVASFVDDKFDAAVLELPYIFGTQPGRQPVWTILIEQIKGMDKLPFTMYPGGGTAMLTVRQVGQAIVGATEKIDGQGFKAWPIGMYNMSWKQFLKIVYNARGMENDRKILSIPAWVMRLGTKGIVKQYKEKGIESGLDVNYLPYIMNQYLFIDNKYAKELGVEEDDINAAIYDSVKVSVAVVNGEAKLIGMRGE
ncbi:MAG: NAD-dependent epimerase/dehydratase family protein [Erysipelotrichaceae bacterium]|jgi:nucleoside-diphosphate-sugar epimerase|nr:NAD-dependent epimerase/dehydratase family protein [Erysipelotrichaceae bacterium]